MAPLTLEEFIERFPDFEATLATPAGETLVQKKLDEAWRRTPTAAWGEKAQDAQGYLAAHLLAISGFGRDARVISKDGSTTYGNERIRMELEEAPGVAPRTTRE